MATLYFNNAVDFNWATLGNWWEDVACTVPATALPGASDDVYMLPSADIAINSGSPPTIATLNVAENGLVEINITVSGGATFVQTGMLAAGNTLTGNASFSNNSVNGGTIVGNAEFSGGSSNPGTVTGNATFSSSSDNAGTVTGNASFFSASVNTGNVGGNAVFDGGTMGGGTVSGGAEFTAATMSGGTVFGVGSFTGSSTLSGGTIDNVASFNASEWGGGTVGDGSTFTNASISNFGSGGHAVVGDGTISLYDSYFANLALSGSVDFHGTSSAQNAYITGNVTLFGTGPVQNCAATGTVTALATHAIGTFAGTSAGGGFFFGGSVYDFIPHAHYEIAEVSTVTYTSPTPVVFNISGGQYWWAGTMSLTFSGGMPTINMSGCELYEQGGQGYGSGIIYANVNAASATLHAPCSGNLYAENSNVIDEPMLNGNSIGGTATFVNSLNGYGGYGGPPGCSVTGQASYVASSVRGNYLWWSGNAFVIHYGPVSFESTISGNAPAYLAGFIGTVTMDVPAAASQIVSGEGYSSAVFTAGLEIIGANRGINGSSILGVI